MGVIFHSSPYYSYGYWCSLTVNWVAYYHYYQSYTLNYCIPNAYRHLLLLSQTPNVLDSAREKALTEGRLMQHAASLASVIDDKSFHSGMVWNMDESMVDVSANVKAKVIQLKDAKKTYGKTPTPPSHITFIGTIAFVGSTFTVFILVKNNGRVCDTSGDIGWWEQLFVILVRGGGLIVTSENC